MVLIPTLCIYHATARQLVLQGQRLGVRGQNLHLIRASIHDLARTESMWVPHEDLLLRLQAHSIVGNGVLTAAACAVGSAKSIIGEAFAVELEATRFATVAWLEALLCSYRRRGLLVQNTSGLGKRLLKIAYCSHFVHNRVIAVHLECMLERLINARVLNISSIFKAFTLKLLKALIRQDSFVES